MKDGRRIEEGWPKERSREERPKNKMFTFG